jgi:hypothetical protein
MLYAFAAVAMISALLWPANSSALAAAHTLPAVAASTEGVADGDGDVVAGLLDPAGRQR